MTAYINPQIDRGTQGIYCDINPQRDNGTYTFIESDDPDIPHN